MSRAIKWLAEENQKRPVEGRLLLGALLVKAVALALHEVPELNGFWKEGRAVPSKEIHVGMAISLRGGGLIAPALHNADKQSLDELMKNLRDLTQRARDRPLAQLRADRPDDHGHQFGGSRGRDGLRRHLSSAGCDRGVR